MMLFTSTRSDIKASATRAVANSTASDGGLYVPLSLHIPDGDIIKDIAGKPLAYAEERILSLFFDDLPLGEIVADALKDMPEDPAPILKCEEGLYTFDLTQGPTGRADDFALGVFSRLYAVCRRKEGLPPAVIPFAGEAEKGRTLLSAFCGVKDAYAIAFFDEREDKLNTLGISGAASDGCRAVSVRGEDIEGSLKKALKSDALNSLAKEHGVEIVRGNELNVGRALAYIPLFFSAYAELAYAGEIKYGDKLNIALPVSDLTAATACCYAKLMGLPVGSIVLAANANSAVAKFVNEYVFEADRPLYATLSHEFDALVPDNIERLTYMLTGFDPAATKAAMDSLFASRRMEISPDKDGEIYKTLQAGWADEDDVRQTAFNFFDIDDCVFDAHSAVTASVFNDYSCETGDDLPALLVETVNPYINAADTLKILGARDADAIKAVNKLENITALERPSCITGLAGDAVACGVIPEGWTEDAISAFIKELHNHG